MHPACHEISLRRPGRYRNYSDKTVKGVAVALKKAKSLTMRYLVLNLNVLFNRGTFRFEPLRECRHAGIGAQTSRCIAAQLLIRRLRPCFR